MKYLLTAIGFAILMNAGAQNDPVFSHYMINPLVSHPGWAAVEKESHATVQVRSQWTGYRSSFDGPGGAPNTQFVSALITSEGFLSGIGAIIINDDLGPLNNLQVNFPIAKEFNVGYNKLSVAVQPGLFSQTQKFDELRFVDPDDPFNVGSRETQLNFNLGAGLVFRTRSNAYVAITANNILEPGFNYGFSDTVNFNNNLIRSYTIFSGLPLDFTRDLSVTPNLQVRSDLNTFTFDLGGVVNYKERGWAGLSYRWDEAITLLIGYSFLPGNKLKVGYAFDYVTNEREAKQPTSQEFFVRYALPNIVFGGRKQVKTPRFTY